MTRAALPERILRLAEERRDASLLALVGIGFALRVALVAAAEHRLDADESTVGVMALDILEGRALPVFFYGQSYNGGGAFEAYLGAAAFAVAGASELVLKLVLAALWLLTALLFSRLCRRLLPDRTSVLAVFLFCLGTPFLLEWSVKARGGYAETLVMSLVLVWLAKPTPFFAARLRSQGLCFGLAVGIGLWASEMLALMIPSALLWLVALRPRHERFRALIWCTAGFLLGSVPMFMHNAVNDWQNYADSTLASLFSEQAGVMLSADLLWQSAAFVLGPAHGLALCGLAIGGLRIARARPLGLPHVMALHIALFLVAYWVVGTRFIPGLAPSRVLYVLAASLAITVACGVTWNRDSPPWRAWLGGAAIAGWTVAVLIACASWASSGEPREAGSWRGSWALTDGSGLYEHLTSSGVDSVVVDYWTRWPLQFAARSAKRRDREAPTLAVHMSTRGLAQNGQVAFALRSETPLLQAVVHELTRREIAFSRSEWRDFVLLEQIDAARVRAGIGLPPVLDRGAWKPQPRESDGFN